MSGSTITRDIRLGHRPDSMKKWKKYAHKKERNIVKRRLRQGRFDDLSGWPPWVTNNTID